MTAILGAIHQQIPFLIGDAMISSPNAPSGQTVHPMTGLSSVDAPVWWDTRYAVDWRQKLIRIGDHLMVAWSGSLLEARAAIKAIREAYANIDPTNLAQVEECIKVIDELGLRDTDLIFLFANSDGWRLSSFGKSRHYFKTNWSENAVASGSGIDALVDVLDAESEFNEKTDAFNKTLGQLVMAAARMWFFDLSGVGQTNAFGGCFEMAIRQNNAVVKLDDVLFASHVYIPEKGIALLPYFLKIDYFDDLLIARVIDFSKPPKSPDMDVDYKRADIFIIPPVDRVWTKENPMPKKEEVLSTIGDLNAAHFGTFIKIESVVEGQKYNSAAMYGYNTIDRPIQFEYSGGELPTSFFLSQEYLNGVTRAVANTLKDAGEPVPDIINV